ncbi:MAG: cytochrome c biogenesis protein ResB [Elusimicrobiota bacterium]
MSAIDMRSALRKSVAFLSSIELGIASLVLLMILVVLCTLDQVNIGTFGAVEKYFRSFFLYGRLPLAGWRVPVFPGGALVGGLLLANVTASAVARFQLRLSKTGVWMIHLGLMLLILGEFVTGVFSVETQMAIEEGASRDYSESPRRAELVVIDGSEAAHDKVFSVGESSLREGREFHHPAWPFSLRVAAYFSNSAIGRRPDSDALPPSRADRGAGRDLVVRPLARAARDDVRNQPAAFVELLAEGRSLGTWLVGSALGRLETFSHEGRTYALGMRPLRRHMPFTLTLKDFRHDVYPGTEIPKNFSSRVRLTHPEKGEARDVLIYMNHPLRYLGRTFYQASYGKNDTLSVLQVVENPGWLLPYIAFIMMALGLAFQFTFHLLRFRPAGAKGAVEPDAARSRGGR